MLSGELALDGRVARWWFGDRHGGVSLPPYDSCNIAAHVGDQPDHVRANRDHLAAQLDAGELSWMGPAHGINCATLDAPTSITPNVDALLTTRSRTPLVTLGADCVPLLLAAGDVVIAAHVGWRGFVAGMTDTLVAELAARDIQPQRAHVLLGPAICGRCYGVPAERANAVAAVSPTAVTLASNGDPGVDIRIGLTEQWRKLGATVDVVGPCTFEDPSYFSHRRDGITGRQAGVIAWMA